MNIKRLLVIIIALLTILSCETVIDIGLPDIQKKLIVNCLFETSMPFKVYVNHSTNILVSEDSSSAVNNATVRLYGDNESLGIIPLLKNGVYINDTLTAIPGIKYKLVVDVPGYNEVWAEDTAPEPTVIDSVDFDPNTYYDSEGIKYHRTGILFSDDPYSENYYEVILQNIDVSISYGPRNENDRVITNEGDELFYSRICVFSDESINGQQYWLRSIDTRKIWEYKYKINLMTTSKTMYKFRKSWIRHDYAQNPDILNQIEPVTLFTNINGGYGIFAGYSNNIVYINFDGEE